MDSLRALILVLVALISATPSHAVIPASQAYSYNTSGNGPTGWMSLDAFFTGWAIPRTFVSYTCTGVWNNNTTTCTYVTQYNQQSPQTIQRFAAGLVCPANATLAGSNCTCNSGYEEHEGACRVPVDPNEEHCQSIAGSPVKASWVTSNPSLSSRTICMVNAGFSCTATVEGDICGGTGDGSYLCHGSGVSGGPGGGTGCTPSPVPEAPSPVDVPETNWPDAPPPGMCPGQINGVTVNVPCSDTSTKTTSTTNTDDGQGTQTGKTESKSTTCTATGTCTTTTTTTTSVNGGAPTTSTSTTTQPKAAFCAANKGSTECGDGNGSSFAGSCQASFSCTGDAVQCATAKAVNDHLCKFKEFFEMDAPTKALVESVVNGTWVENPKDNPREVNIGTFDQSNPLGDACPGDVAYSVMGVSMVLPLSQYCPQLRLMGNLLVAFTLLAATVFVVRGGTA